MIHFFNHEGNPILIVLSIVGSSRYNYHTHHQREDLNAATPFQIDLGLVKDFPYSFTVEESIQLHPHTVESHQCISTETTRGKLSTLQPQLKPTCASFAEWFNLVGKSTSLAAFHHP